MTRLPMALPVPPARTPAPYVATSEHVEFAEGFHDEEVHELDRYRWMCVTGVLRFARSDVPRYLELWALSEFHDLSQTLTCVAGQVIEESKLVWGWAPLSVAVPAGVSRLELTANKLFPQAYHPADTRPLAIRVRPPRLHRDPLRHEHIRRQHANAVQNVQEMLDRRDVLDSTPISLGIDLYGVCNVKPPCVYCEWDYSKGLEGSFVDAPFTPETLREWGSFFDNSVNLVNCSIGEPFMMKEFDDLLDAFGDAGKVLEMTTNGQILTDRNIQKLLGRPIDLYISLDAGTAETYAKLRNDRFNSILDNLRRLISAKGGPGRHPHVHLVFMPMRANVHELDRFVQLCAELDVDRLVLRPLNHSPSVNLKWNRAGYRFEYQHEVLPFRDLVRVSGRAAELCRRYGVQLADQMDFGGAMGEQFAQWFEEGRQSAAANPRQPTGDVGGSVASTASSADLSGAVRAEEAVAAPQHVNAPLPSLGHERKPACTEPWKSLYILRRGIFPCCYGCEPIAPMDRYAEAWNGATIQAIRSELSAGRFHDYCLRSTACPIVRKAAASRALPPRQIGRFYARRWWAHLDRVTNGRAGKVYRVVRRIARAATDPHYVVHHVQRLRGRSSGPYRPRDGAARL